MAMLGKRLKNSKMSFTNLYSAPLVANSKTKITSFESMHGAGQADPYCRHVRGRRLGTVELGYSYSAGLLSSHRD